MIDRLNYAVRTAESVTEGHPDKLADQISDAVLDAHLATDPDARVAVETLVTRGLILLAGEVTSKAEVDIEEVARRTALEIGYGSEEVGLDANTCDVQVRIQRQTPEIAAGVDHGGAGDQGIIYGFACNETPELLPAPITIAHALTREAALLRKSDPALGLRPDGKSQVTVQYEGNRPIGVRTVLLALQHDPETAPEKLRSAAENVVGRVRAQYPWLDWLNHELILNPTGSFIEGGPAADTGLTGRKVAVDTYGGLALHGGGAFSGKDPTKVDRSAAYMARLAAKTIVATGAAERTLISVAHAIGRSEPVMIQVEADGLQLRQIEARDLMGGLDFRPRPIIERLELRRPIYGQTARNGHFGHNEFSWEEVGSSG